MENVHKIDLETAWYIIGYFPRFLTAQEGMAIRHNTSILKLEDSESKVKMTSFYRERGWITSDERVLDLLKNGYPAFQLAVVTRILSEHGDELFFNNCSKCGKLALTPQAKQCRHCGHSWRVGV